jgi:hypothetical protein
VAVGAPTQAIGDATREQLRGLADLLIPAAGSMPSGGEVGARRGGGWDRVLHVRPDLLSGLEHALALAVDGPGHDPDDLLQRLGSADPSARDALLTVVAGAYYLDEEVRRAIGYPGQEAKPVNAFEFPPYVAEGLLDEVARPVGAGTA